MSRYLPGDLPAPRPDPWGVDEPFWKGLDQDQLRIQRCAACGTVRPPAEWICFACQSPEYQWIEVPTEGEVFSWTRVWHPPHPALADACPYVIVVTALAAYPSIRFVGNLLGDPEQSVDIGVSVHAVFEHGLEGEQTLLQWRRS